MKKTFVIWLDLTTENGKSGLSRFNIKAKNITLAVNNAIKKASEIAAEKDIKLINIICVNQYELGE